MKINKDGKILSKNFFKKLNKIRNTYGDKAQVIVAVEELAELQQALIKFLLRKNKKKYRRIVLEEMADVRIMLFHIEKILKFADKDIWNMMFLKINKHYDMIINKKTDVKDEVIKSSN